MNAPASAGRVGRPKLGRGAAGLLTLLVALAGWAVLRHGGSNPGAARAVYDWDFGSLWKYRSLLISGLATTLLFTVLCVFFGLAVGVVSGLGRLSRHRWLAGALRAYVEVFRCTPVLVQLVWFYYALPVLTGIEMSAVVAATLCLSLYGGAFYSEIVRSGVMAIDAGQWEAGEALGLTRQQVLRRIVLPQAFRKMVPPLMSQSIMQLKNTSLLSVLAVPDLLYQGQVIAHDTYRPLEIYTLVALAYFAVLLPITLWSRRLELQTRRPAGERALPNGSDARKP